MNVSTEGYTPCEEGLGEASHWMYAIQAVVAVFVILENLVMLMAIIHNWYNLTRQHNIYRYLVSLVVADLLYGVILLVHGVLTAVHIVSLDRKKLLDDALTDFVNNMIAGVLHGSRFASLASASLLNLVLRMTYTRALARAAAIEGKNPRRFSFLRLPSLRCPRTTRILIGFIWMLTLTFIVMPLKIHCHQHINRCTTDFRSYKINAWKKGTNHMMDSLRSPSVHEEEIEKMDCSFLRPPNSRSYLLILNFFITISYCLMLMCNMMTICIKTTVKKSVRAISGDIILTLQRKPGITWDSSSLLVGIVTFSMTVSTLPYVIFSFITEGGFLEQRLYYASTLTSNAVLALELTTILSSLLNPYIYTAMLGKLRNDIARLVSVCHKNFTVSCVTWDEREIRERHSNKRNKEDDAMTSHSEMYYSIEKEKITATDLTAKHIAASTTKKHNEKHANRVIKV